MLVVVPSCRRIDLGYLAPLIDDGARFIVVDDTEGTIAVHHPAFRVISWADRRRLLGSLDHAIPRKNGACRALGFYLAWRESDDDEVIVALDDDCRVEARSFGGNVDAILDRGPGHVARGVGDFFNVLDLYGGLDGEQVFPRGFPYSARSAYRRWTFEAVEPKRIVFNLGLWDGVLDVNAIDKLQPAPWQVERAELLVPGAIVPPGVLACFCSMNMQFRRSVAPAVWQFPMNIEVLPPWTIDRYGDIWGGFVLKALADIRGDVIAAGGPVIQHLKQEALERNIRQEHLGHLVNDEFIRLLRETVATVQPACYIDMVAQLQETLTCAAPRCSPILRSYLGAAMPCLDAWVSLFRRV